MNPGLITASALHGCHGLSHLKVKLTQFHRKISKIIEAKLMEKWLRYTLNGA